MRFIRQLFLITLLPILALSATASGIRAVVNDDIITTSEVEQRTKLALLISNGQAAQNGMAKLQNDILDGLIDEKIKMSSARSVGLSVDEAEVEHAVNTIEQNNKMPAGTLDKMFASQGVSIEHFKNQIRAQLAWRNYVRARIVPQIKDSPVEVERILEKQLKEKGPVTEYLLAEIFIPIRAQSLEADAKATANRVRSLSLNSARFGELARSFSEAPSRTEDGIVGWVVKGQYEPIRDNAITSLKVGGTSQPIKVANGYYIYRLLKKRSVSSTDESELEGLRERIAMQWKNDAIARQAATTGEELRRSAYIDIR
ncbi:MAG: peptidylprolyl isomerase [Alphaproteobacteria bacterium]